MDYPESTPDSGRLRCLHNPLQESSKHSSLQQMLLFFLLVSLGGSVCGWDCAEWWVTRYSFVLWETSGHLSSVEICAKGDLGSEYERFSFLGLLAAVCLALYLQFTSLEHHNLKLRQRPTYFLLVNFSMHFHSILLKLIIRFYNQMY